VEQLAKLVNSFEQKKDSRVRSLSELQKLDLIRQGELYFLKFSKQFLLIYQCFEQNSPESFIWLSGSNPDLLFLHDKAGRKNF